MKSHGLVFTDMASKRNGIMNNGKNSSAQKPAVPFVENYLPTLMARAHALMAHEFHEIVCNRGFTVSEWRILASLADRGPGAHRSAGAVLGDEAAHRDARARSPGGTRRGPAHRAQNRQAHHPGLHHAPGRAAGGRTDRAGTRTRSAHSEATGGRTHGRAQGLSAPDHRHERAARRDRVGRSPDRA